LINHQLESSMSHLKFFTLTRYINVYNIFQGGNIVKRKVLCWSIGSFDEPWVGWI